MEKLMPSMEASNIIQLADTKIIPKPTQLLGSSSDPTVYRLELEHNTNSGLPKSVIVKLEKNTGVQAFEREIDAYKKLQSLQGTAEIDEKKVDAFLEKALYVLWEWKAEYNDENPSNFLVCQDHIVIVDLEDVEFLSEDLCWERSVNSGNADYLSSRYRYMRNPDRPRSPMDFSRVQLSGTYASTINLAQSS
ncbi:hypothetical protein N7528_000810 [Penicillium herquei]|nr:hypothetical protein N7528_000810 [Penicillium herquei]